MNTRYLVRNIDGDKLPKGASLLIYCVGFESRSKFVAQKYSDLTHRTLAIVYDEGHTLSFPDNLAFARHRGFPTLELGRDNLEERLKEEILKTERSEGVRVVVDVSSMNRAVMAGVLVTVLDMLRHGDTLSILYAPSKFREPGLELLPIQRIGAPHPRISGEVASPRKGRVLLLGVGFEYGVSLNILDSHEPDESFVFRPIGFDDKFDDAVKRANFGFDFGERDYEVIDYHLNNAAALYDDISSLVVSMKHSTTILAVPLGPKLLSAIMIFVGYVHQPSVSVIRYSLASWNYRHDVTPAGMVVGIEITKVPSTASSDEFAKSR